jgi:hypothetical protein
VLEIDRQQKILVHIFERFIFIGGIHFFLYTLILSMYEYSQAFFIQSNFVLIDTYGTFKKSCLVRRFLWYRDFSRHWSIVDFADAASWRVLGTFMIGMCSSVSCHYYWNQFIYKNMIENTVSHLFGNHSRSLSAHR